jgi:hypothetical protein
VIWQPFGTSKVENEIGKSGFWTKSTESWTEQEKMVNYLCLNNNPDLELQLLRTLTVSI